MAANAFRRVGAAARSAHNVCCLSLTATTTTTTLLSTMLSRSSAAVAGGRCSLQYRTPTSALSLRLHETAKRCYSQPSPADIPDWVGDVPLGKQKPSRNSTSSSSLPTTAGDAASSEVTARTEARRWLSCVHRKPATHNHFCSSCFPCVCALSVQQTTS